MMSSRLAKVGLIGPAVIAAIGFAGLLGAGSAAAAPTAASQLPGYTAASWWSPGCVTWHASDGSCVGGQESKNIGKGMNCAARLTPPYGVIAIGDKDYRDKCLNLNDAE